MSVLSYPPPLLETGERGTVKVRHLAQAHDAMIQLGFRNHTYSPQVQCTDNKATESPTSKMRGEEGSQKNRMVRKENFKMKGKTK